jgi:hypothetical protein
MKTLIQFKLGPLQYEQLDPSLERKLAVQTFKGIIADLAYSKLFPVFLIVRSHRPPIYGVLRSHTS